ncbi:MAG: hypothetical protein AAF411_24955, partial [Myxococcota bacterium]
MARHPYLLIGLVLCALVACDEEPAEPAESDAPLIAAGEELGRRNPGVSLRVIGGLSAEALAQIKAARGNSPYDLAVMGSPAIVNALAEDVI